MINNMELPDEESDNIMLYLSYKEKKRFMRKEITLFINDEKREINFQHLTYLDTKIRKGTVIKDVFVWTGLINMHGYYFRIKKPVQSLHLEATKKGFILNGQEAAFVNNKNNCITS